MPTKNPRINVVLEKPLYNSVHELAKKDGMSLSLKVRDLIKETLEIKEDVGLLVFAEKRGKTFVKSKGLKHNVVW